MWLKDQLEMSEDDRFIQMYASVCARVCGVCECVLYIFDMCRYVCMYVCVCVCVCICRERERDIYRYRYIDIYIYIGNILPKWTARS